MLGAAAGAVAGVFAAKNEDKIKVGAKKAGAKVKKAASDVKKTVKAKTSKKK